MTSSASTVSWLPAAIARAAVVTARPAQNVPPAGRHSAPSGPSTLRIATPEDLLRSGRHAEADRGTDLEAPAGDEVPPRPPLGSTSAPH